MSMKQLESSKAFWLSVIACSAVGLCGCAGNNEQLGMLAGNILSATGLGTASQGQALFSAGGKLAQGLEGFTEREEYYLGRGVAATILGKYRPVRNAALTSYVNKVGSTLAGFSDRPETYKGYYFMVLDSEELNAMAAPGGFVFVTKGLIKRMPDEDALAAVLAHEVAHVVKGHGINAVSQSHLASAGAILAREGASMAVSGTQLSQLTSLFGDSIDDVTETLLTKGYSKSQEYDADEYAAELLERAGYNPGALLTMLSRVAESGQSAGSGGWFSTHPDPEDRKDEVEGSVGKGYAFAEAQKLRAERFRRAVQSLG